jgi:hypothetical protein
VVWLAGEAASTMESVLMESSHFSALQTKHASLERRIQQEMARPIPDMTMVQSLKRRKLRIKEELVHT